LARTLSLFLIFSGKFYKSKMKECSDRTLFMKDDFTTLKNDKSINKTNQESKYLHFCRAKAYYIVQHTFLTEAVLTLSLYKTPSGYCTSFASQVRVTTELQRPKCRVFIQIFLVCFFTLTFPQM